MSKPTRRPSASLLAAATAAVLLAAWSAPRQTLAATPAGEEPAAEPAVEGPTEADPESPPPSKWVWGKYDAPTWKKAALGTSAALTVVALGVGLGTLVQVRPGGPLKRDLTQAAQDSLTDEKPSNDVDPYTSGDLCSQARSVPSGGSAGTVTNAKMVAICNKAETLGRVSTAGLITAGVLLGATVVFTVLMFVHKRDPKVVRLQQRGLRLGVAPIVGGWMAGAGMRF